MSLVLELAGGLALGVAVPWVLRWVTRVTPLRPSGRYLALEPVAAAVLLAALASVTHANLFLAAFAGGVTTRSLDPGTVEEEFRVFGELLTELLKLGVTFLFGAFIGLAVLTDVPIWTYLFAVLALVAVRPAALSVAFVGSGLDGPERLAAAWFGPKGFASVVYALLVRGSGVPGSELMFHVVAIVVTLSMVLHSSTDVLVAHRFVEAERA